MLSMFWAGHSMFAHLACYIKKHPFTSIQDISLFSSATSAGILYLLSSARTRTAHQHSPGHALHLNDSLAFRYVKFNVITLTCGRDIVSIIRPECKAVHRLKHATWLGSSMFATVAWQRFSGFQELCAAYQSQLHICKHSLHGSIQSQDPEGRLSRLRQQGSCAPEIHAHKLLVSFYDLAQLL